jgi:hypothetical protein
LSYYPVHEDNQQIILQGRTEVEGEMLRSLMESHGLDTFHIPSLASAIMGRSTGFRFAIRQSDEQQAREILDELQLRLEDFTAVRSAYNQDIPYHFHRDPQTRSIPRGAILAVLTVFVISLAMALRACF